MERARFGAIVGLVVVLLAAPALAEANDWHGGWGRGGRHGGWRNNRTVVIQRSPQVQIVFRGRPYYYNSGRFYERRVRSYVPVTAPVGIIVRELPSYQDSVVIDGTTYYCYDGIYYKGGPAGYQVVSFPIANVSSDTSIAPFQVASAPRQPGDQVTINVPNANGSYMPVQLKEMNGLYIGPNGEVYSSKPTVDQLKIMYGR